MDVQFQFRGGVRDFSERTKVKFLLFLVSHGSEVSFYDGLKRGMIKRIRGDDYRTDCPIVKIFVNRFHFGKARLMYSFYMHLGTRNIDRQIIEIKPPQTDMHYYVFRAEAKFLKKSEAMALFPPNSFQAKMINRQQLPPLAKLREMVTIHRPQVVESARALRSLRIRE